MNPKLKEAATTAKPITSRRKKSSKRSPQLPAATTRTLRLGGSKDELMMSALAAKFTRA